MTEIKDMKISMTAYIDNKSIEELYPEDLKISVEFNNVSTINDFMNGVRCFAIAAGFAEESFDRWWKKGDGYGG